MLKFIYDFLFHYFDKYDVCLLNSDTDSIWIGVSNENLDSLVKPYLKRDYFENYHKTWPSLSCEKHRNDFIETKMNGLPWNISNYDCCEKYHKQEKRTPLLFKYEYTCDYLYALNCKTYHAGCLDNTPPKFSTKGISKRHSDLVSNDFKDVLESQTPKKGKNISFCSKDSNMYTYKQERVGLSYLYCKRIVSSDGFTTSPTNV